MRKIASRIGDFGLAGIGSYLTAQMIPGVSSVTNTAGGVAGALNENAKEEMKNRGHVAKSLIPGVGAYRQGVIARAVADESGKKGRKQLLHEMIGSRLSMFGTGMAGAAGGAYLGKKIGDGEHTVPLAVAGGIGGMAAPSVVAAIVALSTKTRSKRDQDKAEKRNILTNYIPGVGDYQYMKRLGRGYDKYFDKQAGDKSMYLKDAIRKKAAAERIGDWAGGGVSDAVTGALLPGGQLLGIGGYLKGLTEEDAEDELKERGSVAKSIIPSVGKYRQGQVMRAVADKSGKRGRKQLLHEVLGGITGRIGSAVAGGAIGAGVGNAIGNDNPWDDNTMLGATLGAGAGALLPEMTAGILALVKKTRTQKEQSEHEEDNLAKNYIPGVGAYNKYKRLGTGYDQYFEGKTKINKNAGDKSMNYLTQAIAGQTSEPRKQAVRNLLSKEAKDGDYSHLSKKENKQLRRYTKKFDKKMEKRERKAKSLEPGATRTPEDQKAYRKNRKETKQQRKLYKKEDKKYQKSQPTHSVTPYVNKEASDRKGAVRNYLSKLAGPKCGEDGHYCSECEKYGESTECGCGSDCGCDMKKEAADYSCPSCGTACPTCKGGVKKEAGTYAKTQGQYDKAMTPLKQPISPAESTAASGARKIQLAKDKEKRRMEANRKAALVKSNTAQANYDAKKKKNSGAYGKDTQHTLNKTLR